jgi:hypothetical protein
VPELTYYCDDQRHLVCVPYSVENLHLMARELHIHQRWFHNHARHPHYDIPSRRIPEIIEKCNLVKPRQIVNIINGKGINE